jgi:hypothetical protein
MGQRHQIYVINKTKGKYSAIGAHHHQWLFGVTAASNLVRMVSAVERAKNFDKSSFEYYLSDPREVDTLVKAIFGIGLDGSVSMVHNEGKYLIDEDGNATPSKGDNNDGCTLIVIDNDKKQVRGAMFAFCGVEGFKGTIKNWTPVTPEKYLSCYYTDKEIKAEEIELERYKIVKNHKVKPVTQAEFNKIFAVDMPKKTKKVKGN